MVNSVQSNPKDTTREKVLVVQNLVKEYKAKVHGGLLKAVNNVSFSVEAGEIVGFLGPNGAGKSTTIKMITSLARPTSGDVFIMGKSLMKESEEARSHIGGIIESPDLYLDFTAKKNLEYFASLMSRAQLLEIMGSEFSTLKTKELIKKRIEDVLIVVGLKGRELDLVKKYSLGMKQRLGIAQALLSKPRLLILDEPANGLDPKGIREIRDLLKELAVNHNIAVLVSSHQLAEMQLMCDRVLIISNGVITAEKSMSELALDDRGQKVYLIKVDEPTKGANLIKNRLNIDSEVAGNSLRIHTEGDISIITRELVLGGINIFGVSEEEIKLEDVFIQATVKKENK